MHGRVGRNVVVALPDRHDAECILDREGARRRRLAASEGEGVGAPLTLRVDVDAGHAVGHDVDQGSCWWIRIIIRFQGLRVGGHWGSTLDFGDFYAEGMNIGLGAQDQGSRIQGFNFFVSGLEDHG